MRHIDYSVSDGVATIRFNRPEKKNALTLAMFLDFKSSMAQANADEKVRAVIVTGAGNAFTAGNDITIFRDRTGRENGGPAEQFMRSIAETEKPLIAAVNGVAAGVGVTMLLHCDLVYVADDASFLLPFINLGMCSEFASSITLPATMGLQRASEILFLGEKFNAQRAMEFGFVNAIHPAGDVYAAALAAARRIAGQSVEGVRATRAFLRREARPHLVSRLLEERNTITDLINLPEAQAAFAAFLSRSGRNGGTAAA
ncbi:1,4-dihydroxy-2-naphthoyl-CoA synthase [Cupriavidus laharis]|uniref:1,4-dihydroxy-2-naphthoyl-CoA synthase n=1 Tax=Cupriavidus laharis TaxID=151654 RepID=A0ABN7YA90_9BURK|nr:enoyl-CoA hydratase-related protein [Cupriavidus laharis]CAG9169102.1 1,4-dihydroxy-2-naphthoyl-CoA synthase [Cupriavidus laharis]